MSKNNQHLGGHINKTNIDSGLIKYLKGEFNIKTMVDVGCGPGGIVDFANKNGITAIGVEGDPKIKHPKIVNHDFTLGKVNPEKFNKEFDLGYTCEFLEHVEEKYMDNYMDILQRCKYVVFTAAPEKWTGTHHVNCQGHEYWIKKFNEYGFIYSHHMTKNVRKSSNMNSNRIFRKQFMKQRGMFMYNTKFMDSIDLIKTSEQLDNKLKFSISPIYTYTKSGPDIVLPKVDGHIFTTTLPHPSIILNEQEYDKLKTMLKCPYTIK